jgi:hypothetical protein
MTVAIVTHNRHLFAVPNVRLTFAIMLVAMTLSPSLSGVAARVACRTR